MKVYRVNVSALNAEEKQEVRELLRDWCAVVFDYYDDRPALAALLAFWAREEDFNSCLALSEKCAVTDVTGQDLTALPLQ